MTNYERYLGLPMVGGKSKVSTFREVQERVTKRVMGWKEKKISKVGREVLIKTVAQAIPIYSMSIFKIPKKICDEINSQNIGGAKHEARRKSIGLNGVNCTIRRTKGEWALQKFMHSTLPC